jgi:hypothetical protein
VTARWLLPVLVLLSGCAVFEVTPEEAKTLERIESMGLRRGEAGEVPSTTVGLANAWGPLGLLFGPRLGVMPLGGAGNFYLSSRVREGGRAQWWIGVLNSVLWPVSPLWSVPQVLKDSDVTNQKETAFFFTRTVSGASVMNSWESRKRIAPSIGPWPLVPEQPAPAPGEDRSEAKSPPDSPPTEKKKE